MLIARLKKTSSLEVIFGSELKIGERNFLRMNWRNHVVIMTLEKNFTSIELRSADYRGKI